MPPDPDSSGRMRGSNVSLTTEQRAMRQHFDDIGNQFWETESMRDRSDTRRGQSAWDRAVEVLPTAQVAIDWNQGGLPEVDQFILQLSIRLTRP